MTDRAPMDDVALNQTWAHAFARLFVRPLIGTWVRPNHLTLLRFAIGVVACVLLAMGPGTAWLWSGICWFVACVLDRADGELARMANLRSASGQVLDYYSDMILDAGWFLGAGIGLRHGWLGDAAVALGLLSCASMLICSWTSEAYEQLSGPGIKVWYGVRRFHPDDALFILAPVTWLGWLAPILITASACTPVIAAIITVRYLRLRRARTVTGRSA